MSHNKIKVGTAEPDVNGDIALSVDDIVSGTPNAGDTIQYNGSAWETKILAPGANYLYISTSTANAYSNSPATSTSSGDWYFYGDNIINNIGATITKHSTTDWITSITLPAGDYILRSATFAEFSASGYLRLKWIDSSSNVKSNVSMIGDDFTTYGGSSSTCIGYLNETSSVIINCEIVNSSNVDTVANQGNTPSEYNYILILKVA
jgi:hypothetical protein